MESQDLNMELIFQDTEVEYLEDANEEVATTSRRGKEEHDLKFVKILESIGKVLLEKSQAPAVKIKKKKAADKMCERLMHETAESYTADKVIKKVANMKQRLKKLTDMKKTGNVPIVLKSYEKLFLELMHGEDNPSITPSKCGFELGIRASAGLDETLASEKVSEPVVTLCTTASRNRKRSFSETSSDNNKLQHTVLQNQLQLINMQKEMFSAQEQRQQQLHNEQMEVLALEKKVLAAKLNAFDKN